jgi:RNA polymerase sigma factor (sigma-70 family)
MKEATVIDVEMQKRSWPDFAESDENLATIETLAGRAREGDREAAANLYFALVAKINRFARRYGARVLEEGYELEDLYQEAYVVFAEFLPDWNGDCFFRFFLGVFPFRLRRHFTKITGNHRRAQVVYLTTEELESALNRLVETDTSFETANLWDCFSALTPWQRQVALYRVENDLTFAQIATRLGINRVRAFRIWKRACASIAERQAG